MKPAVAAVDLDFAHSEKGALASPIPIDEHLRAADLGAEIGRTV